MLIHNKTSLSIMPAEIFVIASKEYEPTLNATFLTLFHNLQKASFNTYYRLF